MKPLFTLGRVVATPGALAALEASGESLLTYLQRHLAGDWGDVDAEDAQENELSLISTCRRHEIDPQLYLTQLLVNLPSWPARDLDAWLPDQWKLRQAARLATLQDTAITDS